MSTVPVGMQSGVVRRAGVRGRGNAPRLGRFSLPHTSHMMCSGLSATP